MICSCPAEKAPRVSTARVVLADDHPFYRTGLSKMLRESGVNIVAEAGNGWAALKAVEKSSPDVVVLDQNMPGMSGDEVAQRLTSCDPPHRVIILSVSDDESDVMSALRAGASGYLLKDGPVEEIVSGIAAAAQGETFFSPRMAKMLRPHLVERERVLEDLRDEGDLLARLAYPVIVRGVGAVLDGPRPHLL